MKIKFDSFSLYVEVPAGRISSDQIPVFFLHGFTGSSKDWHEIIPKLNTRIFPVMLDFIGHGKSDSPDEVNFYSHENIAEQIKTILQKLNLQKVILCGYSMGGRAAISFAAKYPEFVKALILESASFGIEKQEERILRQVSDEKLSEFILNNSIEEFVDYWMKLPLFISQINLPESKLRQIKRRKLKNNKTGISNSLKGFSTGVMPYFFGDIYQLDFPKLLITGELDEKYTEMNKSFIEDMKNAEHIIFANCRHTVHLENPDKFVQVIHRFIEKF